MRKSACEGVSSPLGQGPYAILIPKDNIIVLIHQMFLLVFPNIYWKMQAEIQTWEQQKESLIFDATYLEYKFTSFRIPSNLQNTS